MSHIFRLLLLLILLPGVALAQSVTEGTIKGTVVDEGDIAIPGVMITLVSENLMATFTEILRESPSAAELSMAQRIATTEAARRSAHRKDDAELMKTTRKLGAGGKGISMR